MNGIPLGRIFGVPLAVHWTLPALLLAMTLLALDAPGGQVGPQLALLAQALIALALHELGHALGARLLGARVGGVMLHLFGGLTWIDARDLRSWREIPVAAGGPAVNLLTGLLALSPAPFLAGLGRVSLLFGGLNLAPVWPLDGGRILRALLALRLPWAVATVLAAVAGLVLCLVLLLYALFFLPPWWCLIPLYLGAVGWAALGREMAGAPPGRVGEPGPETEPAAEAGPAERPAGEPPGDEPFAEGLAGFRGSLEEFIRRRRESSTERP